MRWSEALVGHNLPVTTDGFRGQSLGTYDVISRRDADLLLNWLCANMGFCSLGSARAALVDAPPDAPLEFARAVCAAEGLDADVADSHLFRQVLGIVTDAYRDGWPT